jgi:hypothetical protein
MEDKRQLYKEYSLLSNMITLMESPKNYKAFLHRSSINNSNLEKFRSKKAFLEWQDLVPDDPYRYDLLTKVNVVRKMTQLWIDNFKHREHIIISKNRLKNKFYLFLLKIKYFFTGKLKSKLALYELFYTMCADLSVRLNMLDGGVENQQSEQELLEQKYLFKENCNPKMGFN